MKNSIQFKDFFNQYVATLTWLNDDIEPTDEALEILEAHALSFYSRTWYYVSEEPSLDCNYSQLGHDFALTQTRQGAGFWDGDWPKYGELLTKISHCYPEDVELC